MMQADEVQQGNEEGDLGQQAQMDEEAEPNLEGGGQGSIATTRGKRERKQSCWLRGFVTKA